MFTFMAQAIRRGYGSPLRSPANYTDALLIVLISSAPGNCGALCCLKIFCGLCFVFIKLK